MVSSPATPNTFLVDMSHQQLWLEAETQSVSSLEVDSESDSEESETDSGSSSSEEDEEEEIELPPPPISSGRVSRHDRIQQQKLEQAHTISPPQQLAPVQSSLRKTKGGMSAPNLKSLGGFGFRKPTNLGGLRVPVGGMMAAPTPTNAPTSTATPKSMPNPDHGLKPPTRKLTDSKKKTNANWNNASGASKAGLSLLNDVRIGMSANKSGGGGGGGLTKMRKSMASQLLDASLTSFNSSTSELFPQQQRPQQEGLETTVNITAVSVSVSFSGSRTPSQGTMSSGASPKGSAQDLARVRRAQTNGPVIISPKRTSRSPRRANRRVNSSGDVSSTPMSEEEKHALISSFRHIQSDPSLWVVEHASGGNITASGTSSGKANRWNSNSIKASGSDHTRESRKKKKTLVPTSIKVIGAMPAEPIQQQPSASRGGRGLMHGRQRSSAPNLLGMTLSIPTDTTSDGRGVSPAAKSRWSSNSRMKTTSSASSIKSDRDPVAERWAPVANTRRNLSSHSVPDVSRWLAEENKMDDVAADRWESVVAPSSATPKQKLGKAKSLSDLMKNVNKRGAASPRRRQGDKTTTDTTNKRAQMMTDNQSGSAPNLTSRRGLSPMRSMRALSPTLMGSGSNSPVLQRGIQRTSSRMVMSTSSTKLSVPNLQAITNNRGGGGSAPLMPPPPPPSESKNARWSPTGILTKAGSLSSLRPNSSNALNCNKTSSKAAPQRGLQRRSPSQTLRKKLGGSGLSSPNLAGLTGKRTSGNAGSSGSMAGGLQRGVQRFSSKMVMSTSSSGLRRVGLSAPNLLRAATVPQSSPSNNSRWSPGKTTGRKGLGSSNALESSTRPSLQQQRGSSNPMMNKVGSIGLSTPNLSSLRDGPVPGVSMNAEEPETRLQRGVQRSSSKMVMSTSTSSTRGIGGIGLSAPNLVGLSRHTTVPNSGSRNAKWGGVSTGRTSGTGSMVKSSNLLQRGVQRASSRMVLSSSNLAGLGLSAPHLQTIMHVNTMQQSSGSNNAQWISKGNDMGGLQYASSLLEQAVKRTTSRPVAPPTANRLRGIGISAPNLAGLQRSAPVRGPQNAQWVPKSSPRLGGPTLSMNPMVSVATPASPSPSLLASSRWDSSSNFDGLRRSSGSGSNIGGAPTTDIGMRHSNHRNSKESRPTSISPLNNLKSSRIGASAPNLMAMKKRVYAVPPLNGSSNTEWAQKPRTKQPIRNGLEAMLDDNRLAHALATPPPGLRRDSGSSGNLSGADQLSTKKMLPARRISKSGGRRKKKKHKEHSKVKKKADTVPPKIMRTKTSEIEPESDSEPPTDASLPGIRRCYTEESAESVDLAEEFDGFAEEVTAFVTSEVQCHNEESENSVAQATASLAALEITRSARMALRKERSNNSLGGGQLLGGTHRLGCTETIPETGDESVDAYTAASQAYDRFVDESEDQVEEDQVEEDLNNDHHQMPFLREDSDKQLKIPVRQSSGPSQKRGSVTDENMLREPLPPTAKPISKNGPIKPVRRASVVTEGLSAMMPGLHQSFGIDDDVDDDEDDNDGPGETGPPTRPGNAIHVPTRRASVESTGGDSFGLPFSHIRTHARKDSTMSDCSELTMPSSICSSSTRPYPASLISHKSSSNSGSKKTKNMFGSITGDVFSFLAAGASNELHSRDPGMAKGANAANVEAKAEEESHNLEGSTEDSSKAMKFEVQPEIIGQASPEPVTEVFSGEVTKGEPQPESDKASPESLIESQLESVKASHESLTQAILGADAPPVCGEESRESPAEDLFGEALKVETQLGTDELSPECAAEAHVISGEVMKVETQSEIGEQESPEDQPEESCEVAKVETKPEFGEEIPSVEETEGVNAASQPLSSNSQYYGQNPSGEEAKAGKDCSRALPSRLPSAGSTPNVSAFLRDGAIA